MANSEQYLMILTLIAFFIAGTIVATGANLSNLLNKVRKKKPEDPPKDFCENFDSEFKSWVAEKVYTNPQYCYTVVRIRKSGPTLAYVDKCAMFYRTYEDADKQRYRLVGSSEDFEVRKIVFDYKWL